VFGPKGHGSLAEGLPWETIDKVRTLKLKGRRDFETWLLGASSGPQAIDPKPRVNPKLSFPGPSGQRDRTTRIQFDLRTQESHLVAFCDS
jgi:hypothetical protein